MAHHGVGQAPAHIAMRAEGSLTQPRAAMAEESGMARSLSISTMALNYLFGQRIEPTGQPVGLAVEDRRPLSEFRREHEASELAVFAFHRLHEQRSVDGLAGLR